MGLTIAALVIGAAFGWILVGGRFKKLSVRRMFRER
jgi:hypothetical protein